MSQLVLLAKIKHFRFVRSNQSNFCSKRKTLHLNDDADYNTPDTKAIHNNLSTHKHAKEEGCSSKPDTYFQALLEDFANITGSSLKYQHCASPRINSTIEV